MRGFRTSLGDHGKKAGVGSVRWEGVGLLMNARDTAHYFVTGRRVKNEL